MIECTKSELVDRGFTMGRGLICDVLSAEDVYGFYGADNGKGPILVMKTCGDVYFPHRARDMNGKAYGEGELFSGEFFDMEDVSELIKKLGVEQ